MTIQVSVRLEGVIEQVFFFIFGIICESITLDYCLFRMLSVAAGFYHSAADWFPFHQGFLYTILLDDGETFTMLSVLPSRV